MTVDLAFEPSTVLNPAGGVGGRAGIPLVLLHAFPLDRSMWRDVAALLRPVAPVLAVDLPGLGASPVPAGTPDLDVSADAVAAVLDRLGYASAILAGVSMGGYVAMAFARRHRDRLAGLALLDTRADADGDQARANRLRMAKAVLGEAGTRVLIPMLDTLLGSTTHRDRPELVAAVQDRLLAAPPAGVAWSQQAMAARPDSLSTLAGLAVPAAVLVGEEDGMAGPSAARAMADVLPDVVLTVVPRAGHLTPLEAPAEVAHALTGLVLRVASARGV